MYKCLILALLLLAGCQSTQTMSFDERSSVNQEKIFTQSNNQQKLIEFYQQALTENEDPLLRIKLARAYLEQGDAESVIFTLAQLSESDDAPTTVEKHESRDWTQARYEMALLQAKAHFYLDQLIEAKLNIDNALALNDRNGEAYNVAGVIAAATGELTQAERYFISARKYFYSDDVVKNNLAVVYLMQHQYRKSYQLLLANYKINPDDQKGRANLVIAMVKLGKSNEARHILTQHYDDVEANRMIAQIETDQFSAQIAAM
ncbi:secretion protein [Vibrio sp. SM6]|uniref:Secretion protein n=1 Tax=Vibrio agarilyticus TaxID=2726741 RepID=A0A7X8TSH1_9VIBR|nr:secretion protein [Vibrio agarilyticus]NLS13786.1 secretion protein [Vibrio agarilyticus]